MVTIDEVLEVVVTKGYPKDIAEYLMGAYNMEKSELTIAQFLSEMFGDVKNEIKSKEDLEKDLCKYCTLTDYGNVEINTNPMNLCEGISCDSAYESYIEELI